MSPSPPSSHPPSPRKHWPLAVVLAGVAVLIYGSIILKVDLYGAAEFLARAQGKATAFPR